MFKKGDIVILGIIIVIIFFSISGLKFYRASDTGEGKIAVIRQNNKEIKRIDLDKVTLSEKIELEGDFHNVILIEKGRIRFIESDCNDLVCVNTAWISEKGQMAVCLPNKVSIKIEGFGEKVDGVTF